MSVSYNVTVTANKLRDSDRLDRVLSEELPSLSRTRIQELIAGGKVERAGWGTLLEADTKVQVGDVLLVNVPPVSPVSLRPENIPLTIVFEDRYLCVIDKPPNLVVHPGSGNWGGTMVNAAVARYPNSLPAIKGRDRPGIVHRLDKDTSGLMVLAKTEEAFHSLAEQFSRHSVERMYLAVTWGHPRPAKGRITSKIGRSTTDRQKMANVLASGKLAITRYKILRYIGDNTTMVSCWPETGRTHQIRVHLAGLGCPIVGDATYGVARRQKGLIADPEQGAVKRQALHAQVLGFRHPIRRSYRRYFSHIPLDIKSLCEKLEEI